MPSSRTDRVCVAASAAVFSLCLSLSAPYAVAQTDAEQAAGRHFEAAHNAQNDGDLDRAAREYQEALRYAPETAEIYASLGMVYNAQGKYAESARALEKAKKLKPGLPGVSLYLGIDYEQQHNAAIALPVLESAVRNDPASKEANMWLGRTLWALGRRQQALLQLQRTSELFPADPALLLESGEGYRKAAEEGIARVLEAGHGTALAHRIYGDIYMDERAWSNAQAHYFRALALDPHWAGGHFGLGEVALRQQRFDTAKDQYQQELKVNPRSASSLARLGEVAMLTGKADDALPLLKQAIDISAYEAASALGLPRAYPGNAEDLTDSGKAQMEACVSSLETAPETSARSLALAVAYLRLGNKSAFARSWQSFTQDLPAAPAASGWQQAQSEFFRQDFLKAAATADAWGKAHPADLAAQYLLARSYRNLSLNSLAQLLDTAPDSYPAHILLAESLQNAERNPEALKEFRAASAIAPDVPGIHYSIGHLLDKAGQTEEARDEFAAELRLNPEHPEANAEMGKVLLNQQDTAGAIPYLEKAVKADPELWPTYNELGKAYYAEKNYSKAEAALEHAVRHDPEGQAHFQLALVYRSLGRKQDANAQFDLARKLKLEALTHDETKMTTLKDLPQ